MQIVYYILESSLKKE